MLLGVGVTCLPPAAGEAPPATIRITTGLPGMTFKPLGEALVGAYGRRLPDMRFSVIETAGSVSNLQLLQEGRAELGLALADVSYMAYNGHIPELKAPTHNIRGVAVLHPSVVHVLVPGDSAARSVSDLRGDIGLGALGSGTTVTAGLLLRAFGVPPDRVRERSLPFMDASDALTRHQLDAAFVVAAAPVDAVERATRTGARLLDVNGPPLQRLREEYPFLRPAVIPPGTYPGMLRPVQTLLVDVLLVCRADLDERLVRRLTGALFEILPGLSSTHEFLRLIDLDRTPATPIALHPGAALYYREKELGR
jgi:TRAP transporter TAXI family solute receptor